MVTCLWHHLTPLHRSHEYHWSEAFLSPPTYSLCLSLPGFSFPSGKQCQVNDWKSAHRNQCKALALQTLITDLARLGGESKVGQSSCFLPVTLNLFITPDILCLAPSLQAIVCLST